MQNQHKVRSQKVIRRNTCEAEELIGGFDVFVLFHFYSADTLTSIKFYLVFNIVLL